MLPTAQETPQEHLQEGRCASPAPWWAQAQGRGRCGLRCPPPPLCRLPLRLLQIHGLRDPGPGHKGVGNRRCFGKCFGISGTLTQFPVSGQFRSGCVPNSDTTAHGSTAHSGKVPTARPTGSERGATSHHVSPKRSGTRSHYGPDEPRGHVSRETPDARSLRFRSHEMPRGGTSGDRRQAGGGAGRGGLVTADGDRVSCNKASELLHNCD